MPRPGSRETLLEAGQVQFEKLQHLIESMTPDELHSAFDFSADASKKEAHWSRDRCLRDVLIHLYEWHRLLLAWVAANQGDNAQPFLPEPYTWKTYGEMNVEFFDRHQSTPLKEARRLVQQTHGEAMAMIEKLNDQELFEKKHFDWTGTTSLGSYCTSATSSHYEWAIKKLRAHLKMIR